MTGSVSLHCYNEKHRQTRMETKRQKTNKKKTIKIGDRKKKHRRRGVVKNACVTLDDPHLRLFEWTFCLRFSDRDSVAKLVKRLEGRGNEKAKQR